MYIGLLDVGDSGGHKSVSFVDISKISTTQDAFYFGAQTFNRLYRRHRKGEINMERYIPLVESPAANVYT